MAGRASGPVKYEGVVEVGTGYSLDGVAPSRMVSVSASPLHIKSRSSLLAPAHLGAPGKRAVKWLWLWCGVVWLLTVALTALQLKQPGGHFKLIMQHCF